MIVNKYHSLVLEWLKWYYLEAPSSIIKAWKNTSKFVFHYFSIGALLRTLFSPWRKYKFSYVKGFDLWNYLETVLSNLIFRLIGFLLRSFLIFIGMAVEVFVFFLGFYILLAWLILPLLLFGWLFHSLRLFLKTDV